MGKFDPGQWRESPLPKSQELPGETSHTHPPALELKVRLPRYTSPSWTGLSSQAAASCPLLAFWTGPALSHTERPSTSDASGSPQLHTVFPKSTPPLTNLCPSLEANPMGISTGGLSKSLVPPVAQCCLLLCKLPGELMAQFPPL